MKTGNLLLFGSAAVIGYLLLTKKVEVRTIVGQSADGGVTGGVITQDPWLPTILPTLIPSYSATTNEQGSQILTNIFHNFVNAFNPFSAFYRW